MTSGSNSAAGESAAARESSAAGGSRTEAESSAARESSAGGSRTEGEPAAHGSSAAGSRTEGEPAAARQTPAAGGGLRSRARALRARIRAVPGGDTILKIVVATTGAVFVALGLILVPLPGPGWAIVFGGLAIWAIEFAWAQNLLDWVRRQVRAWTAWFRRLPWPLRILLSAVVLAAVAGVAWLWIGERYGFDALSRLWNYLRTH
jgi:uncharacterized protein (TIGR02611 family)